MRSSSNARCIGRESRPGRPRQAAPAGAREALGAALRVPTGGAARARALADLEAHVAIEALADARMEQEKALQHEHVAPAHRDASARRGDVDVGAASVRL